MPYCADITKIEPLAYYVGEAARVMRTSEATIMTAIKRGQLRSYKLGKRRMIARQALLEWQRVREDLDWQQVLKRHPVWYNDLDDQDREDLDEGDVYGSAHGSPPDPSLQKEASS